MRHWTAVNSNGSNLLSVIRTRVAWRALPLPVPSDAVDFAGAIAAYERLMRRADNLECVNAEVVEGAVGHRGFPPDRHRGGCSVAAPTALAPSATGIPDGAVQSVHAAELRSHSLDEFFSLTADTGGLLRVVSA